MTDAACSTALYMSALPGSSADLLKPMTIVEQVLAHLHAGRWKDAHDLVQKDGSVAAAWLHGILHLQEGDLEDAENWYSRADRHFRSRGTLAQELALFEESLTQPSTA